MKAGTRQTEESCKKPKEETSGLSAAQDISDVFQPIMCDLVGED